MSDNFSHERSIARTRKEHQCSQCLKPIPKGSVSKRHSGIWDGGWFCDYAHPDCFAAWMEWNISTAIRDDEWVFLHEAAGNCLPEEVRETLDGKEYEAVLQRLGVAT